MLKLANKLLRKDNNTGYTWNIAAEYELDAGLNPMSSILKAVGYFEKAIQLNSTNVLPYSNLGESRLIQARFELAQRKNPVEALQLSRAAFKKAIGLNPDLSSTYSALAAAEIIEGRRRLRFGGSAEPAFDRAQQMLDTALRLNKNDAFAYVQAAELCLLQSPAKIEEGLEYTSAALSIIAEYADALIVQSKLYSLSGQPEPAKASLQKAFQKNPLLKPAAAN